jgi:hypothetical protein
VYRGEEELVGGDRRGFGEGEGLGEEHSAGPHRGGPELLTGDYLNGDGGDGGERSFSESWSSSGSDASFKLKWGIGLRVG